MSGARSRRARWACGLAVVAGVLTIPLNAVLVLAGFAGGDFGPVGNLMAEEGGAWVGNLLAALMGGVAVGLGWWHRRDIERRGAPPVDAGLARAGELLGAVALLLGLFLFLGTAQLRHWI